MNANKLAQGRCRPLAAGAPPLAQAHIDAALARLPGWEQEDGAIRKTFSFKNYTETMAFANGVAWIAQREDHHPDMLIGYDRCRVTYRTHSVGGISENDLICAAKIEALCRI